MFVQECELCGIFHWNVNLLAAKKEEPKFTTNREKLTKRKTLKTIKICKVCKENLDKGKGVPTAIPDSDIFSK